MLTPEAEPRHQRENVATKAQNNTQPFLLLWPERVSAVLLVCLRPDRHSDASSGSLVSCVSMAEISVRRILLLVISLAKCLEGTELLAHLKKCGDLECESKFAFLLLTLNVPLALDDESALIILRNI